MKTTRITTIRRSVLILGVAALCNLSIAGATEELELNEIDTLGETALSGASGKGDLQSQTSDVNQNATLGDNQLTAAETGKNNIDGGSFDNLQGIAHVIQNTGNNVIIQDSTTFNVQFVEAAN